jgi:hypothetical protein
MTECTTAGTSGDSASDSDGDDAPEIAITTHAHGKDGSALHVKVQGEVRDSYLIPQRQEKAPVMATRGFPYCFVRGVHFAALLLPSSW